MGARRARRLRPVAACLLAGALALGVALRPDASAAQSVAEVAVPETPLVLASRGSLTIGGERVEQSAVQISSPFGRPLEEGGHVTLSPMYVDFMVPAEVTGLPVILVHGATMTGKTYSTTPDGRMGWDEYFVRRGHATYVPDQVGRGRSSLDIAGYNDARAGLVAPGDLPYAFRGSDEVRWKGFRMGPQFPESFPDSQFSAEAWPALARQLVPDFSAWVPRPNPTVPALADLARELGGAVVIGHSQSGAFPLGAALHDPAGVRAMVLIEPGSCARDMPDAEVTALARIPVLVVFGDHLDADTGLTGFTWTGAFENCQAFVERMKVAGGRADMLHLPERGLRGNTHLLMQDANNLEVADLILEWIAEVAPARGE